MTEDYVHRPSAWAGFALAMVLSAILLAIEPGLQWWVFVGNAGVGLVASWYHYRYEPRAETGGVGA